MKHFPILTALLLTPLTALQATASGIVSEVMKTPASIACFNCQRTGRQARGSR